MAWSISTPNLAVTNQWWQHIEPYIARQDGCWINIHPMFVNTHLRSDDPAAYDWPSDSRVITRRYEIPSTVVTGDEFREFLRVLRISLEEEVRNLK